MTVLCDFTEIVGDTPQVITPAVFERNFRTGGRTSGQTAFLLFNVRGLTNASVLVQVNNQVVGAIFPYPGSNTSYWYTQMIALNGSQLRDGDNEIQIEAVGSDSFEIKNMVCFFHQSA
jgi:hypothetical protein